MKTSNNSRTQSGSRLFKSMIGASAVAFSLALCASPLTSFAQDASALPTQPVSVSLSNAPVRVALDALFKSAGLNYTIDPAITQNVTVNLHNVPFDVALRSILRSTNPPLQYTVKDGIYQISQPDQAAQQSIATPSVNNQGASQSPSFNNNGSSFSSSGSDSNQTVVLYLTYINGTLLNKLVGPIIDIPPSLTIANGTGGGAGGAAGGATGGGSTGGFGGGSSGGFGGGGGGGSFGGSSGGFGGVSGGIL